MVFIHSVFSCSVVKEELAVDDALLPQVNGRVVCWVSYGVCCTCLDLCYVFKFKAYFVCIVHVEVLVIGSLLRMYLC